MWRLRRDWLAGIILVSVGLWLLSDRLFPQLTPVIPLVAGVSLLVLVLVTRSAATLVLGGVLVGVGVGILVARGGDQRLATSGLLASIGAGFLLIWLIGLLLHLREVRLWPLVPAALFLAGAAALAVVEQGEQVQRLAQDWWPVVLIVFGVWLMIVARSAASREEEWVEDEQDIVPPARPVPPPQGRDEYRLPSGEPAPLRPGLSSVDPPVVPGAGVPIEPLAGDHVEGERRP